MSYDEAKTEVFDVLIPKVGLRITTYRNVVYEVVSVDKEQRRIKLWEKFNSQGEDCNLRYDEYWRWITGLYREPLPWQGRRIDDLRRSQT